MADIFISEEAFNDQDWTDFGKAGLEFENCSFHRCQFSKAELTNVIFSNCEFQDCNFSSAKLSGTAFQNVAFQLCKLLGLQFDQCNPFGLQVSFKDCLMDHCGFFNVNLKSTTFKNCKIREADFGGTNLSEAVFENCDLFQSIFDNTDLEAADLRSAINFTIDPDLNRIKKAKFSKDGLPGLLGKYDIIIE